MTTALDLLKPVFRFGVVGGAATVVHMACYTLFIELYDIPAVVANLLAYGLAFTVSFSGHYGWSFREQTRAADVHWRRSMLRFFAVSIFGLTLNTLQVWLIVNLLGQHYWISIVTMTVVTPSAVFVLSRFWAFR